MSNVIDEVEGISDDEDEECECGRGRTLWDVLAEADLGCCGFWLFLIVCVICFTLIMIFNPNLFHK